MCQVTKKHIPRALSSAGRASALQAEGHRFEPYSAHHFKLCGPVVQLVRMPACHAGGRRFEPDPDRHFFSDTVRNFTDTVMNFTDTVMNMYFAGVAQR